MPLARTRLAAVAAAAALLLAACFSDSSSGGGASGGDPAAQRLRVALAFPPAQALSPFGDDGLTLTRIGTAESLVALDPTGSPVPSLATSWTRVDDTGWRFTLREGVQFHDGTALTAQAAADAITAGAAASPVPRAIRAVVLTPTAEDDTTLLVRTDVPDPVLPQRLSSPALVVLAPSAYDGGQVDPVRAGTGPFVLDAVDGAAGATLSANTGYWGGAPAAAGVDVRFLPDAAARAAALRAGEVDLIDSLPVSQAALLPAGQVLEVPLPRTVALHLNSSAGVFADPALRAAVRDVLDPEALADGVFEGTADPARGIYGPASPWAAQRPAVARTAPGTPAGQVVRLATYSDRAELPETATVVAEQLRGVGFTVAETVREYSELEPDLLAGAFDAVVASRSYLLDTGDPATFLVSDTTCDGSYNLSRLCDPAVDAAVTAATVPDDVAQRRQAALAAEAAVLGTDALLPLVHDRARLGVAEGLDGVAEDPFERLLVTGETRLP